MGLISNIGELAFIGTSDSTPSTSAPHAQPAPATQDQVYLATIPLTSQAVQQLQDKNPPNLQAVLGDAIRDLRAAASQSADQIEAAYLSGLADRFERLEESGSAASPASAPAL